MSDLSPLCAQKRTLTKTRLSQDFRAKRESKMTCLTAWTHRAYNFHFAYPSVHHLGLHASDSRDSREPQAHDTASLFVSIWLRSSDAFMTVEEMPLPSAPAICAVG